MLKPMATLAATGVVGLVLIKLVGLLLFPLLGVLIGFVVWALKLALIAALIWWGFHLFKRWNEKGSEA
ncbi:MAG: hypothetical protein HYR48_07955 [Gemmatimonadetes bacterium]|nr:hypothetical protein [Gemmatimonadota bacterium]